jgi:hypothetical protein
LTKISGETPMLHNESDGNVEGLRYGRTKETSRRNANKQLPQ